MIVVVLRSTLTIAGLGIVAGLVLAAVLTRPLTPQLFGVSPTDVPTYAATAGLLLAVAAFAAFLPARRAARIEPTEALRAE